MAQQSTEQPDQLYWSPLARTVPITRTLRTSIQGSTAILYAHGAARLLIDPEDVLARGLGYRTLATGTFINLAVFLRYMPYVLDETHRSERRLVARLAIATVVEITTAAMSLPSIAAGADELLSAIEHPLLVLPRRLFDYADYAGQRIQKCHAELVENWCSEANARCRILTRAGRDWHDYL